MTIPFREEWLHLRDSLPGHGDVWFTDGSRSEDRSGAGYYCRREGMGTFLSLGRYAVTGRRPNCSYRLSQGTETCDIIYTKWGFETEGCCRWCGEGSETALYLLTKCPALIRTRMKWFGEYLPSPDLIKSASAGSILGFWKEARLP